MRTRRKVKHLFHVKEPHAASWAAKILLYRHLFVQSKTDLARWLEFRMILLTRWEKERGILECFYCGKGPLLKDETNKHPLVATLDHVIARANGGAEYDENNLVVACFRCNQKKGSK